MLNQKEHGNLAHVTTSCNIKGHLVIIIQILLDMWLDVDTDDYMSVHILKAT